MSVDLRRKDRAISRHDALDILSAGEYGILSSVSADGEPYGVPVSFCVIDESIYFHCAKEGHKLNNISANSSISFCVVGKTQVQPDKFGTKYESTIVAGKAIEVFESAKQVALVGLVRKYSAEYHNEGMKYIEGHTGNTRVFKIVIGSITGKSKK